MAQVSMRDMLQAGVHFGHQTQRWNPKMKPYIYGAKNGVYIINLQKTVGLFKDAINFVSRLGQKGDPILFVGTKRQAQDIVREQAQRVKAHYVNHRWLGGMLTNYRTIKTSIDRINEIEKQLGVDNVDRLTKKEVIKLERELAKLLRNLGGIRTLDKLPGAVFVVDTVKEHIAVAEARKLNIPIVALCDTNSDPDEVNYPIPSNDDAIRAIKLFTTAIADAYLDGASMQKEAFVQDTSASADVDVVIRKAAVSEEEAAEEAAEPVAEEAAEEAAEPAAEETAEAAPAADEADAQAAEETPPADDADNA